MLLTATVGSLFSASSRSSRASSSCPFASAAIRLNSTSSKSYLVGNWAAKPRGTHAVAVIIDMLRLVVDGKRVNGVPEMKELCLRSDQTFIFYGTGVSAEEVTPDWFHLHLEFYTSSSI